MTKKEKIWKYFLSIEYEVVNDLRSLNYGASTFRISLIWFGIEIALWNKIWWKNAISTFMFGLWWKPNFDAQEGDLMFEKSFVWDLGEISMLELYRRGKYDIPESFHS